MIQLSLEQGQRLKHEGQAKVDARNQRFLYDMRVYARAISAERGRVTSDDIRFYATGLGQYPTHHNCWGAVFRGHGWVCIGRKPSALATNHYREIRVWQWTGA